MSRVSDRDHHTIRNAVSGGETSKTIFDLISGTSHHNTKSTKTKGGKKKTVKKSFKRHGAGQPIGNVAVARSMATAATSPAPVTQSFSAPWSGSAFASGFSSTRSVGKPSGRAAYSRTKYHKGEDTLVRKGPFGVEVLDKPTKKWVPLNQSGIPNKQTFSFDTDKFLMDTGLDAAHPLVDQLRNARYTQAYTKHTLGKTVQDIAQTVLAATGVTAPSQTLVTGIGSGGGTGTGTPSISGGRKEMLENELDQRVKAGLLKNPVTIELARKKLDPSSVGAYSAVVDRAVAEAEQEEPQVSEARAIASGGDKVRKAFALEKIAKISDSDEDLAIRKGELRARLEFADKSGRLGDLLRSESFTKEIEAGVKETEDRRPVTMETGDEDDDEEEEEEEEEEFDDDVEETEPEPLTVQQTIDLEKQRLIGMQSLQTLLDRATVLDSGDSSEAAAVKTVLTPRMKNAKTMDELKEVLKELEKRTDELHPIIDRKSSSKEVELEKSKQEALKLAEDEKAKKEERAQRLTLDEKQEIRGKISLRASRGVATSQIDNFLKSLETVKNKDTREFNRAKSSAITIREEIQNPDISQEKVDTLFRTFKTDTTRYRMQILAEEKRKKRDAQQAQDAEEQARRDEEEAKKAEMDEAADPMSAAEKFDDDTQIGALRISLQKASEKLKEAGELVGGEAGTITQVASENIQKLLAKGSDREALELAVQKGKQYWDAISPEFEQERNRRNQMGEDDDEDEEEEEEQQERSPSFEELLDSGASRARLSGETLAKLKRIQANVGDVPDEYQPAMASEIAFYQKELSKATKEGADERMRIIQDRLDKLGADQDTKIYEGKRRITPFEGAPATPTVSPTGPPTPRPRPRQDASPPVADVNSPDLISNDQWEAIARASPAELPGANKPALTAPPENRGVLLGPGSNQPLVTVRESRTTPEKSGVSPTKALPFQERMALTGPPSEIKDFMEEADMSFAGIKKYAETPLKFSNDDDAIGGEIPEGYPDNYWALMGPLPSYTGESDSSSAHSTPGASRKSFKQRKKEELGLLTPTEAGQMKKESQREKSTETRKKERRERVEAKRDLDTTQVSPDVASTSAEPGDSMDTAE